VVQPTPQKPGDHGSGGDGAHARVSAARARLAAVLSKGLKVRLAGAPKGKVAVVVKRGRTVVGRATAQVGADGTATATVRFTKAAKRALRDMRRVTLTISAAGASSKLTLKR
jgi:hypothetical protein